MKVARLFSLLVLLIITIVSCTNSSKNTGNNKQTILPGTGKIIIVDVHTVEEWNNDSHADCTINYALDELNLKIESLKAYEKVVVVNRSGNRADSAKEIHERNGIKNVINKGAWQNVACK